MKPITTVTPSGVFFTPVTRASQQTHRPVGGDGRTPRGIWSMTTKVVFATVVPQESASSWFRSCDVVWKHICRTRLWRPPSAEERVVLAAIADNRRKNGSGVVPRPFPSHYFWRSRLILSTCTYLYLPGLPVHQARYSHDVCRDDLAQLLFCRHCQCPSMSIAAGASVSRCTNRVFA